MGPRGHEETSLIVVAGKESCWLVGIEEHGDGLEFPR